EEDEDEPGTRPRSSSYDVDELDEEDVEGFDELDPALADVLKGPLTAIAVPSPRNAAALQTAVAIRARRAGCRRRARGRGCGEGEEDGGWGVGSLLMDPSIEQPPWRI